MRAGWIGSQVAAGLPTLAGGRITEYVQLCEETRAETFEFMVQHAEAMGANAMLAVMYDVTSVGNNMTEVLAYGGTVVAEPQD